MNIKSLRDFSISENDVKCFEAIIISKTWCITFLQGWKQTVKKLKLINNYFRYQQKHLGFLMMGEEQDSLIQSEKRAKGNVCALGSLPNTKCNYEFSK